VWPFGLILRRVTNNVIGESFQPQTGFPRATQRFPKSKFTTMVSHQTVEFAAKTDFANMSFPPGRDVPTKGVLGLPGVWWVLNPLVEARPLQTYFPPRHMAATTLRESSGLSNQVVCLRSGYLGPNQGVFTIRVSGPQPAPLTYPAPPTSPHPTTPHHAPPHRTPPR
jgi:hypothetical protein